MKRPIAVLVGVAVIDAILIVGVVSFLEREPERPNLYAVSIEHPVPETPELVSERPLGLMVPKLKMDLVVKEGKYDAGRASWTIDNKAAFYATITPKPNNSRGNTLIYGHNSHQIFGNLNQLEKDDLVYIKATNQKIFVYKLKEVKDVEPTDLSLFEYRGKPILTIQTCAGTWYEKRRLFTFSLVEVRAEA